MSNYPNVSEEISLTFPISVAGVEVKALKMRRPKVRDRILFSKDQGSEAQKELNMMARLCNVDPDDLMDMDDMDYEKVQEVYTAFRSRSQSGKSSEE